MSDTTLDISGDIDSQPLIEKEEGSKGGFNMASWTNIGLTGNMRDMLTHQVKLKW